MAIYNLSALFITNIQFKQLIIVVTSLKNKLYTSSKSEYEVRLYLIFFRRAFYR
jgi:hypothetical protein